MSRFQLRAGEQWWTIPGPGPLDLTDITPPPPSGNVDTAQVMYSTDDWVTWAPFHNASIALGATFKIGLLVYVADVAFRTTPLTDTDTTPESTTGTVVHWYSGNPTAGGTLLTYGAGSTPRTDDYLPPYDALPGATSTLTTLGGAPVTITARVIYPSGTINDYVATATTPVVAFAITAGPSPAWSSPTSAIIGVTASRLVASMTVEYRQLGDTTWVPVTVSGTSTLTPSVTLSGLTTDTEYEYRLPTASLIAVDASVTQDTTVRGFATSTIAPSILGRGPTGEHVPPNTPAYTTAHTHIVATAAEINAILATASGGEVIQVTANISGAVTLNHVAAATSWTTNVLIRPPVGQRLNITGEVIIRCDHVTVAGFQLGGNARIGRDNTAARGAYSGYWRCTSVDGYWAFNSSGTNAFFVECVTERKSFTRSSDRLNAFGQGPFGNRNMLVEGCWFGPLRRLSSLAPAAYHCDNIQFEPVAVTPHGITIRDCVVFEPDQTGSIFIQRCTGVITLDNNYVKSDGGGIDGFDEAGHGVSIYRSDPALVQQFITNNDFRGQQTRLSGQPVVFTGNKIDSVSVATNTSGTGVIPIINDGSNLIQPGYSPAPPILPAVLWVGECPYTTDPDY